MENGRSPPSKSRSTSDDLLRRRIMELKKELESERRQSKQAHREKVAGVKAARDEERARAAAEREELRERMAAERKDEVNSLKEEAERRREAEMSLFRRQHEESVERVKRKHETELSELEAKMKGVVYAEARREIGEQFEVDKRKLMREVFEMGKAKLEAERRAAAAVEGDRDKAEKIRQGDAMRDEEVQKLSRNARMENRKQMEELRAKERLLHQKEQELGQVKRNMAILRMENEKISEKLKRTQEAESWQKMSPRAPIQGIGDMSFESVTSPRLKQYDDEDKKRVARNAELSLLTRRLEEKNVALTKEKADLQGELDKAQSMNQPLEGKCDKLMKKNNVLVTALRDRDRRLRDTTEENRHLKEEKVALEQNVEKLEKSAQKRPGNRAEKLAAYYKNESELKTQEVEEKNRIIAKLKEKTVNLRQRLEVLKSSRKSLMKEREEKLMSPGPSVSRSWDEESVSTLHEDIDQVVFEKDEMETKYKELMKEWLKAQRSYAQLQLKLASSVDIERDKMMQEQVRGDLEAARDEIESLKRENIIERQNDEEAHSKERNAYEDKIQLLTHQLAEVEEQLQNAEEGANERKSLHEELQSVNSSFGEKEQELREQLGNLEQNVLQERLAREIAEKSLTDLKMVADSHKKTTEDKDKAFEVKEQELAILAAQLESQLLEKQQISEEEITSLRLKLDAVEKEKEEAGDIHVMEIAEMERKLKEAVQAAEDVADSRVGVEKDKALEKLHSKLDEVSEHLKGEKERAETAVERVRELELEGTETRRKLVEKAETSKLLESANQKNSRLQGDLESLENELAEHVLQLEESKEHNKVLLSIEAKLRDEVKQLQERAGAMASAAAPLPSVKLSFLKVREEELADEDLTEHELVVRDRIRELENVIKGAKWEVIEEEASRIMTLRKQDNELLFAEEKHKEAEESLGKLLDEQIAVSNGNESVPEPPETKPPSLPGEEEIGEELKESIEKEMRQKLEEEIEVELRDRVETEIRQKLESEIEVELRERVETDVRQKLESEIEVEFRERVETDVRRKLEMEQEEKVRERVEAEVQRRTVDGEKVLEEKVSAAAEERMQEELHKMQVQVEERVVGEVRGKARAEAREECQREIARRKKVEESFSILQARYARVEGELAELGSLKDRCRRLQAEARTALEATQECKRLKALLEEKNSSIKSRSLELTSLQKQRDDVTRKNVLLTEQLRQIDETEDENRRLKTRLHEVEESRVSELEQYENNTQMQAEEVRREKLIRMEAEQRTAPYKNENTLLQRKCQAKDEIIGDLNGQLAKLKRALTGSLLDDLSTMDEEDEAFSRKRLSQTKLRQFGSLDIDEAMKAIDEAERTSSRSLLNRSRPLSASFRPAVSSPQLAGRYNVGGGSLSSLATGGRSSRQRSTVFDDKRMFVVLFDYDPDALCTTKQPELELKVKTSDVVVVTGDMDENGLYMAEFEGKRGLIPANFVEELDISDPMCRSRLVSEVSSPDVSLSYGGGSYQGRSREQSHLSSVSPVRRPLSMDLADWNGDLPGDKQSERESLSFPPRTPTPEEDPDPPEQLCIERQLDDSLLVAWMPPEITPMGKNSGTVVAGYKVLVDGSEHSLILGAEQSKALLEGIDVSVPKRITLQTVGRNGRVSAGVSMTFSGTGPSSIASSSHLNGPSSRVLDDLQSLGDESVTTFNDAIEPFGWYVAVYDYDPYTMSPNPDPEAELAFKESDLIKVFGIENGDGFFNAKLNGKEGLIPSNFVERVSGPSLRMHQPMPRLFSSSTVASTVVSSVPEETDDEKASEFSAEDEVSDQVSEISSDAATNVKPKHRKRSVVSIASPFTSNGAAIARERRVSFAGAEDSDHSSVSEEGKPKKKKRDMISRGRKFFKKISTLRKTNKKSSMP